MKRISILLVAAMLAATLSGCSSKDVPNIDINVNLNSKEPAITLSPEVTDSGEQTIDSATATQLAATDDNTNSSAKQSATGASNSCSRSSSATQNKSLGAELTKLSVNTGRYNTDNFNDNKITSFNAANAYFLSANGNDNNSGKSKNQALRTLEAYRNIIEKSNFSESTLYVEDGNYIINKTFNLYGNKFGNKTKVTIQGIGNNATFSETTPLSNNGFKQISLNGKTAYEYNLSQINLNYSPGADNEVVKGGSDIWRAPFIIAGGKKMHLASYPKNDGWTTAKENQQTNGAITARDGNDKNTLNNIDWSGAIVNCYALTPYTSTLIPVSGYNNGRISMSVHVNVVQGYSGGVIYKVLNSKSLVTEPGEYYIDYNKKMLYMIPYTGTSISSTSFSIANITAGGTAFNGNNSSEDSYQMRNGANVHFKNINFNGFRDRVFNNSISNMSFDRCTFKNICEMAINSDNPKNLVVTNCKFVDVSSHCIRLMSSGNSNGRKKLISCGVKINNNLFFNTAELVQNQAYKMVIQCETVNTSITNNIFYHVPGQAIRFELNDNVIQGNEFRDTCYITSDCGTIYSGRDWTSCGNIIKDNVLWDTNPRQQSDNNRNGIYLDDMSSGNIVENNYVEGYGNGIQVGGGRYNKVRNNTFVKCRSAFWCDERGTTWADPSGIVSRLRLAYPDYTSSLWKGKYPGIETLPQGQNVNTSKTDPNSPMMPKGNIITDNKVVNSGFGKIYDKVISMGTVNNNGDKGKGASVAPPK